jgi:hypothetical protein
MPGYNWKWGTARLPQSWKPSAKVAPPSRRGLQPKRSHGFNSQTSIHHQSSLRKGQIAWKAFSQDSKPRYPKYNTLSSTLWNRFTLAILELTEEGWWGDCASFENKRSALTPATGFRLVHRWSCRWGDTTSLNCGHQPAYCWSLVWYKSLENHGGMMTTGKTPGCSSRALTILPAII